jgi:hypothetical protein
VTAGCDRTGNKQERITWQEGRYNKSGLQKDDNKQDEVSPHPVLLDNEGQVLVHVDQKSMMGTTIVAIEIGRLYI